MTYIAELQIGRRHEAVDVRGGGRGGGYLARLCEYLLEL